MLFSAVFTLLKQTKKGTTFLTSGQLKHENLLALFIFTGTAGKLVLVIWFYVLRCRLDATDCLDILSLYGFSLVCFDFAGCGLSEGILRSKFFISLKR
jgi:hypothetical protein